MLSFALILLGTFFFFLALLYGEGGLAIFFIFPVFYSTGIYGALGTLLIFAGILLLFFYPFLSSPPLETQYLEAYNERGQRDHEQNYSREVHYGGVLLIGPIPIVFGSDKNYAIYAAIGGVLLIIGLFLFFYILSL